MAVENVQNRCAVFFDVENIAAKKQNIDAVLHRLERLGFDPVIRMAVSSRPFPVRFMRVLQDSGFVIMQSSSSTKNSADMRIVLEAHRVLTTMADIAALAIVSSDEDFVEIMSEAKAMGKTVISIFSHPRKTTPDFNRFVDHHVVLNCAKQEKKSSMVMDMVAKAKEKNAKNIKSLALSFLSTYIKENGIDAKTRQAMLADLESAGIMPKKKSAVYKLLQNAS